MDIDIHALKALEREREIPFDVLVDAIEAALLGAYHRTRGPTRTPGPSSAARTATSSCGCLLYTSPSPRDS